MRLGAGSLWLCALAFVLVFIDHVGQYGPNLLASEVYERNSRAATALKRSSTVPVHTLGRPNVPRGSPDPQTTHRLLKVPPGAPPGHPQKGRSAPLARPRCAQRQRRSVSRTPACTSRREGVESAQDHLRAPRCSRARYLRRSGGTGGQHGSRSPECQYGNAKARKELRRAQPVCPAHWV